MTRLAGRIFLAAALIAVAACTDDSGGGAATETDTETDTQGGTTTGFTTTTSTSGSTGAGTTGGVPGGGLEPCDPLEVPDACTTGVCAGVPQAGFYCRPACSSTAAVGDACGADGECLRVLPGSEELACFDLTDCDPVTGSGCNLDAAESCVVLTYDPLRTACVPSGMTQGGAVCEPAFMHDCDVGLACLGSDLDGDDPGRCTGWCDVGAAPRLDAPQCIPVTDTLGTCAECSVLADDCPAGSECQPVNEALGGVCLDHGTAGEGENCDFTTHCQAGFLCLETDVDDVFECVQKCDPGTPMCDDSAKSCIDISIVAGTGMAGELGVCIETSVVVCDPGSEPSGCPDAQVCIEVGTDVGICGDACDPTTGTGACDGNYACVPTDGEAFNPTPFALGNGACGGGCSGDGDCGGGNTCLLLDGLEADGVCGTTCDPAGNDCGAMEACIATAADAGIGACVAGGTACDATMPDSCLGMANTACIPLDGGATGVCLAACFEQDPSACGDMPDACQVREDLLFHSGFCLGQPEACDTVMQDCPDEGTCRVAGGQALGGVTYVCNEPGPLAENGDCSADDELCGLGLTCLDGVCRAYCDAAADDCAFGSCTDISGLYYLPADSVAACL